MKKKISAILIVLTILFGSSTVSYPIEAENTVTVTGTSVKEQISALPDTMLAATDPTVTYLQALSIKNQYNFLPDEEKTLVTNLSDLEELLNANSNNLNVENVSKVNESPLEGKTIGYLGSSITVGFQSENVAFADYIEKITGSTSIKQAVTGGPLAKKDGIRDEISYITQLLTGALKPDNNLDALVVQLSTNDAALGIEMGKISDSYSLDDLENNYDYSTIIGAAEYITAYAKKTWNCPVIFYTNPYLSDEAINRYVAINGGNVDEVKDAYQTTYQKMVDALYQLQSKWEFSIIDMWNEESFKNINLDLRDYYMADPIHPKKAGYLFWYTPFIQSKLEECITASLNQPTVDLTKVNDTTYKYDAIQNGYVSDYSSVSTPSYYIYSNVKNEIEAEKLLNDLQIASNLHKFAGNVTVITPINGTSYEQADSEAFIDQLGVGVSNAKVIGIDEGATFVNNYISQKCFAVAGIMTYGGEMNEGLDYNVAVPAYLSTPTATALSYYIKANDALKVNDTTYQNTNNPLQQVCVGNDSSLATAFKNAWNTIFSKNYRQHNETTEFYMSSPKTHTDPYLLIGLPQYDELHLQYISHYNEPLNGKGKYTWFECVPESALTKENGTVPLIISLHGNGNDARLQIESTGWAELAAKENFMVMAPEWQSIVYDSSTHEPGPNFFNCDGLEGDKLIEWIEMLKKTYPQIDASRIYVTGLSAGGSASELYGIKYNKVFAGVGAVSAPAVDKAEITELAENYTGNEVPMIYMCGDYDFFGMIPVDKSSTNSFQPAPGVYLQNVDENCDIFPVIQAYQKINNLTVSSNYDMSLNKYYGIKLDNEQMIKLGVKNTLEGTLSNSNGVIMKFAAIEQQAHWNYKPEAQYMWDFFKIYSRDTTTGTLIRNNQTELPAVNPVNGVKTGDSNSITLFVVLSGISLTSIFYLYSKKN